MLRVEHLLPHHLIAAADTHHGGTFTVGTDDGSRHTVTAQFVKVIKRALGAGQQDDVGLCQLIHIVGIEQMYARVTLQHIEIGEVTEVAQQNDGDVHLSLLGTDRLCGKRHGVFFFDINVTVVRYYPDNGNAAKFLQHRNARLEETYIPPELVDKNSFNAFPLMGTKQHQRTVDAGKHTTTVNVAHKNYIGSGMQGHRQIDKVGIPQIDFGDASRAFQHDGIIAGGKAVVGSTNLPAQLVASFLAEILISIAVADRTPVKDNLRGMVRLWFQQ